MIFVNDQGTRLAAVVCVENDLGFPDLQVARTSGDGWFIARLVPPLAESIRGFGWTWPD